MAQPMSADDLARAHEVADQAERLIKTFGKRLAKLNAAWQAEHADPAWGERVGKHEAWEGPYRASGIGALYDRLEDLERALAAADDRVNQASRRARTAARAGR